MLDDDLIDSLKDENGDWKVGPFFVFMTKLTVTIKFNSSSEQGSLFSYFSEDDKSAERSSIQNYEFIMDISYPITTTVTVPLVYAIIFLSIWIFLVLLIIIISCI